MAERKPTRKAAPAAKRKKSPAGRATTDADTRTVAGIEREIDKALAVRPVGHELPAKALVSKLGHVEVQELDGSWTTLGALWADSPAAITFLRHYG